MNHSVIDSPATFVVIKITAVLVGLVLNFLMVKIGPALLYFSYGISLEMALASRSEQLPEMVESTVGCFPDHLTISLDRLDVALKESVTLCSET
ncbi:hypothetical protein [Marinobacter sp. F3R08]|uniref:hypothetical protein n=1 Tax=Marinobacter sp. F3R08 TaxID=2841559 RepID=UPI001C08A721|nr:hypothetical protein [Marinobacter sp. F3R08]MBU2952217.1 hypothetical protein [Marinobacter sp. F3R08]